MKLLVLNGDLPTFPGRAGHEYLHITRLARLARRVGLVSMVHTREMDDGTRGLRAAGVGLYLWRAAGLDRPPDAPGAAAPGNLRRAAAALYGALGGWRGHPREVRLQDRQFRHLAGPLGDALRDECWEAAIVVQSSCARWLDYLPRSMVSVLVLHDVRALVHDRRARVAPSLWARWAHRREARRYRRLEREACRRYDLVITVSPADEAWVRAHYHPTRLATVAIPVDRAYFTRGPEPGEAPGRLVFTGMMSHPPNADAAAFFAREIMPRVRAAVPGAEFWIVGRDPPPEVCELTGLPGVVVTGFVEDVRPYMAQAAVVVVPLRFGSGMRNKILEAWAMERCVVSTSLGAEGLACADGVNILLGDDPPALASRVIEALQNVDLRDRIRAGGRSLVATAHDPEALARRYYAVVESVIRERRGGGRPVQAVIDLRWMRRDQAGPAARIARSLVNHLRRLDGLDRYTVLGSVEARPDLAGGRSGVAFSAVDGPGARARDAALQAVRLTHRRLGHEYWRTPEVEVLRRVRALAADVVLSVDGHARPDLASLTNVLIVADLSHESHPDLYAPAELAQRRQGLGISIRQASHICVLSDVTRQLLLGRFALAPDRVSTVPPAADPMFHPDSRARRESPRVLEKHGLRRGEYVLLAGTAWPDASHRTVHRALRALRDASGLEPLLVSTAPPSAHAQAAALGEGGWGARARFLGPCPVTDLPGLYAGARAVVVPSAFEEAGLSLLEAMWCDCPVVCVDAASLPEVAGSAALVVDPHSPEAMADALHSALTSEVRRATLIEAGRQRVQHFSGPRFALAVASALRAARDARCG